MKTQNASKSPARSRIWLGLREGKRTVFRSVETPSWDSHGRLYSAVIGPFRTKRGAEFMRDHGDANPHCRTVNDAEHLARGEAYDIVLRKWVKTRAARAAVA
jgi:hypothetical protein